MKTFFIYLTFCIAWTTANAKPTHTPQELAFNYDLKQMENVLEMVKSLSEIPMFANVSSDPEEELQDAKIDPVISELFYQTQKEIFGKNLIQLRLSVTAGFYAQYSGKIVYVNPASITEILTSKDYRKPLDVIKFIFAHELSHFVNEIASHPPYSASDFVSINGLPSAYSPSPRSKAEADLMNTKKMMQSHAEVDVYAALAMKQIGFSGWDDLLRFYDNQIKNAAMDSDPFNGPFAEADFLNRLENVRKILEIK